MTRSNFSYPLMITLVLFLSGCGQPSTTLPIQAPAEAPVEIPNSEPTLEATLEPTQEPTEEPTETPTASPTSEPAPEIYSLGDTQVRESDGMLMVYVPRGEFEMGAMGGGDTGRLPIHTVYLDGFWLDQTEVTNGQYGRCVAAGRCEPSRYAEIEMYSGEDQPVLAVTWHDAQAYCEWAGGALPTEAQWEYAARGVESRTYPWGEEEPDCDIANYLECVGTTAEVGSYPAGASWCGALDMAGNVYEWVADWWGPYTGERQVNPAGPESGDRKIIRGGSWTDIWQNIIAAQRIRFVPTDYSDTVGFRCVVSVMQIP